MSQENVEMIRRGNDAFRRGDWEDLAEMIDPHISIRTDVSWPEQRMYGREAAIAFYRGISESGGPDTRIEEIVDLGWGGRDEAVVRELFEASGQVVSRFDWEVRGRASGIDTRLDLTAVN